MKTRLFVPAFKAATTALTGSRRFLSCKGTLRSNDNPCLSANSVVSPSLVDTFGRPHTYLRISVTERCNLRCTYCMPEQGVPLTPHQELLSLPEILRLAKLFVSKGVDKIRLTGGEPTVRPDIVELFKGLHLLKQHGLKSIAMTSNGIALKRKLPSLVDNGLDCLNLSLDTLDPHMFVIMTRRKGMNKVLASLDEALRLGIPSVKVNVVVMRGVNEDQVLDFVAFTKNNPVTIRFIEYMPFDGNRWNRDRLVPSRDLLDRIQSVYGSLSRLTDQPHDTTKHYGIPGYHGRIGVISSMTNHFCDTCNRLRITADGHIKVCLFGNAEVSLRDLLRQGASDEEVLAVVDAAVKRKKARHADTPTRRPSSLWASTPSRLWYPDMSSAPAKRFNSSMAHPPEEDHCLTHSDPETGEARMVSVTRKPLTQRQARAVGHLAMPSHAFDLLKKNASVLTKKGHVLGVAQIAGIQAAKQTSQLIPLCHQLLLSHVDVRLWLDDAHNRVCCESTVQTQGPTGVEMEALTATSVALLTVYDMCKAASKDMVIQDLYLVEKTGGKSGRWCKKQQ